MKTSGYEYQVALSGKCRPIDDAYGLWPGTVRLTPPSRGNFAAILKLANNANYAFMAIKLCFIGSKLGVNLFISRIVLKETMSTI